MKVIPIALMLIVATLSLSEALQIKDRDLMNILAEAEDTPPAASSNPPSTTDDTSKGGKTNDGTETNEEKLKAASIKAKEDLLSARRKAKQKLLEAKHKLESKVDIDGHSTELWVPIVCITLGVIILAVGGYFAYKHFHKE